MAIREGETHKTTTLRLDADLVTWADYAASVAGTSVNAYINAAIRRDMESHAGTRRDAYNSWLNERRFAVGNARRIEAR